MNTPAAGPENLPYAFFDPSDALPRISPEEQVTIGETPGAGHPGVLKRRVPERYVGFDRLRYGSDEVFAGAGEGRAEVQVRAPGPEPCAHDAPAPSPDPTKDRGSRPCATRRSPPGITTSAERTFSCNQPNSKEPTLRPSETIQPPMVVRRALLG
jgi:hypothetical protein